MRNKVFLSLNVEGVEKGDLFRIDSITFTIRNYNSIVKLLHLLKENNLWLLPGTKQNYNRKAFFLESFKDSSAGNLILINKNYNHFDSSEDSYSITIPGETANVFLKCVFTNKVLKAFE